MVRVRTISVVLLFKQKSAYEMRISDWSSDVCSSDLVRRATALESQALEQTIFIERRVVAEARAAYSRYQATQAVIQSSRAAIAANELALEGVRAENTVGTRNVLDVLNAEQELLNSRVQLVTAERDAYVAGFTLLAAMGRAEARDPNLFGGTLFEPGFSRTTKPGQPELDIDPDSGIEFVQPATGHSVDDDVTQPAL